MLNSGYEYRRNLGSEAHGLKLIDILLRAYPRFSREEWLMRIDSGRVLVNGNQVPHDFPVKPGQVLSWIRPPWEEPDVPLSFAILYQDEHLLGVAKPAGLPTLPGGGTFMANTLLHLVRRHFPHANPLHRLGRGTSGIVLFGLSSKSASMVLQSWRSDRTSKIYRALISGYPVDNEFDINIPIGRVPHRILGSIQAATVLGKSAHSHVAVLERRENSSLVEVRITTGRPHQIRIHLAAAGHPLIGDPLYGTGGIPAESGSAVPGDLGYFLHNGFLSFQHPFEAKRVEISCAPPPQLRLWESGLVET